MDCAGICLQFAGISINIAGILPSSAGISEEHEVGCDFSDYWLFSSFILPLYNDGKGEN